MVSRAVPDPFETSAPTEAVPIKDPQTLSAENVLVLQSLLQIIVQNKELVLVDKSSSSCVEEEKEKKKKHVNPGPLGLLGFGMTTILLNFHNTGAFPLGTIIPAMGLTMGGLLQVLAGLLEYFNGNAFPAVAFMCYGTFWISLCAVWMLPQTDHPHLETSSKVFLGLYLLLWGLFTLVMTSITFCKSHLMMRLLFTTLTLLFALLSVGNFAENAVVLKVAGYDGIVCGFIALYIAFAEIFEDNLGHIVLPLFPMK